jgi:hypothetical protein
VYINTDSMKKLHINGIYEHYSGKKYKVIGVARHSETLEELVVYQGQYSDEEFGDYPIWVRPKAMFLEDVEINGKFVERFTYLED